MEAITIYQDEMENHIEQIIGIADEKKLIAVVFSRNFGANNEFLILNSLGSRIDEIINKSKEILGNIEESTISLKKIDSFNDIFKEKH